MKRDSEYASYVVCALLYGWKVKTYREWLNSQQSDKQSEGMS